MTCADLRSMLRGFRSHSGLVLAILATVAITVGLNTTVFSFVRSILLKPLPGYETGRIMAIFGYSRLESQSLVGQSVRQAWSGQQQSFESLQALNFLPRTVVEPRPASRIRTAIVTPGYFAMYRARPTLGRLLLDGDAQGAQASVTVLDYGFWQSRFGGDIQVIGKSLRTNDGDFQIVGVAERSFQPLGEGGVDAFMPLVEAEFGGTAFYVLGRLKPGVTLEQAKAEFRVISERVRKSGLVKEESFEAQLIPLKETWVRETQPLLWMLFAAAGLVLLLACANLTNLLSARNSARRRDFLLRQALGASRAALLRRSIIECLLLAGVGGAIGVGLSAWLVPLLREWNAAMLPPVLPVSLDAAAMAFSLLVILVAGVSVGTGSTLTILGQNANQVLKEDAAFSSGARGGHRFRIALTALQIGISFALVLCAIGVSRSFYRLVNVDTGFHNDDLYVTSVNLDGGGRATREGIHASMSALHERVRALPGVSGAALATSVPRNGLGLTFGFGSEELPWLGNRKVVAAGYIVSPEYFRLMHMRILEGRSFQAEDRLHTWPVAMISEGLARAAFPGRNPVGQTLPLPSLDPDMRGGSDAPRPVEIVGIVNEIHTDPAHPETETRQLYLPAAQNPLIYSLLLAETKLPKQVLENALRRELAESAPLSPMDGLAALRDLDAQITRVPKAAGALVSLHALVAALLAALGIHGVFSFVAAQRTREIGIRLAVGAQPSEVRRGMLRWVLRVTVVGLGIGSAMAFVCGRLLESHMFEVRFWDPGSAAAAASLVLAIALAGGWLPARRAARTDPIRALRHP